MSQYFAKSVLPDGTQPSVKQHLEAVSDLAGTFGKELKLEEEARLAGLLHDFGKYSRAFQDVLNGQRDHVDHAFCGAALLAFKKKAYYQPVIEAIHGHHDGLVEYQLIKDSLFQSYQDDQPLETGHRKRSALAGPAEYRTALNAFCSDFPAFTFPKLKKFSASAETASARCPDDMALYAQNIESMLYTRMLFSCLVDADYSISARDTKADYLEESENTGFDPEALLHALFQYRNQIKSSSNADSSLNQVRDRVFDVCGEAGTQPPGLYTLTAPTGTGKTLALLHFALRHCAKWGMSRVIIVLPYLTLTEQNADTYRHIIPNLLEDHSQKDLSDQEREFSSRWRVPMIVTTSVQFFETLFAQKPADCRKLHNLANSVIVFDEAQSLPPQILNATLLSVKELCRKYRCTMLFSTATQPDFIALPNMAQFWQPTEILPDNAALFHELRRTDVEWRLEDRTDLTQIAQEMAEKHSVCAIVNLRKHARKLYTLLKEQCREDEVFFLTTDLCTAHRREVVSAVRERQQKNLPCRVVATQCIEAGVDLDFEAMYRALAPLDSIIQAAGRCNRNGKAARGQVIVFIPDEPGRLYPGDWYQNAAELVRELCCEGSIDIHDPKQVSRYYMRLFQAAKDKPELKNAILDRSFCRTEEAYRWIEDQGIRIIVRFHGQETLYNELEAEAKNLGVSPRLMKRAAGITVSLYWADHIEDIAEQLKYSDKHRHGSGEKYSNYYILRPQYRNIYRSDMGLQLPDTENFCGLI